LDSTKPGVFAAGDAVLGPATVVEAVAQGNEVAMAVDAYLQEGHAASKEDWLAYTEAPLTWVMEDYAEAVRAETPVQEPATRRLNWREVEHVLEEGICREQCKRCLRCDIEETG